MDKAAYLERKRKLQEQDVPFKKERTCYRCYWLEENCRCGLIRPFRTDTRFIILMHNMEARKVKLGTGRICHATLVNSEIIVGVDFTHNAQVNAILDDPGNTCSVLYPGKNALNISKDDVSPLLETIKTGRKPVLFVIDATWPCAKKMMTLSKNIRKLPRLSFTPSHESIYHIKEQPAAYCLSTLESIHHYLSEADRRGVERLPARPQDNLIVVFKSIIDFAVRHSTDPERASYRRGSGGFSKRAERKKRRSKSGRNIVLMD